MEEVQNKSLACLHEVDILMSRETSQPCLDNLETAGRASGRVSFGIMLHQCLPRSLCGSLTTWTRCLPNGRGNEGAEDEHMKLQRKAWRARCVLGSQSRMLDIALVCLGASSLYNWIVSMRQGIAYMK